MEGGKREWGRGLFDMCTFDVWLLFYFMCLRCCVYGYFDIT